MRSFAWFAAVLLASGCGHVAEDVASRAPVGRSAGTAMVVSARERPRSLEAWGTVRPVTSALLSARVTAHVTSVLVREGDRVEGGQLLVLLDARDALARLEAAHLTIAEARCGATEASAALTAAQNTLLAANARHRLASAALVRQKNLVGSSATTRQDYDEAVAAEAAAAAETARSESLVTLEKARVVQAKARHARAQADAGIASLDVEHTRLVAPFAGRVVSRLAEPGQLASPGAGLLRLDTEDYRFEAEVPEATLPVTSPAEVWVDALSRKLTGTVDEVVPAASSASRTVTVKLALGREDGLRAGLSGTARFRTGAERVLTVPAKAVFHRGQLRYVTAIDGAGAAVPRLVTLGAVSGGEVEVLSGLAEGERIEEAAR